MRASHLNVGSPTLHATIFFTIAVFTAIVIMAIVFKVEVVATGLGKVVPTSRVQVVQSEFGGQITAIHVRNGDQVHAGDLLIELNQTDALAELKTVQSEADRLKIERARLGRMLELVEMHAPNPEELTFSAPDLLGSHPYYRQQKRLLLAEYEDYRASVDQISSRIETNKRSMAVSKAAVTRIEDALQTRGERMQATQQLMEQGTTPRSAWLEMLESFRNLENEREIALRELDTKRSQETSLHAEQTALSANLRNRLHQRLNEIDARQAALEAQLAALERRVAAARLLAPVSGVVDQLDVFTIGGVVQGGQELLRIVPDETSVEIEAMFANLDVGFLEVGQNANIRLDAFPSERFGFVTGRVIDISADSVEIEDANFVYIVRANPDEPVLRVGDTEHALKPGMTLTVDVITDERRIISYFFAPIMEVIERSLGER